METGNQQTIDTTPALFIHVRNETQRAQAERLIKPSAARGISCHRYQADE